MKVKQVECSDVTCSAVCSMSTDELHERVSAPHRFETALAGARRAELDPAVVAALAEAGEAYGGTLVDGAPYAWVEGPREDARRRVVDALARLAELRETAGELEGALAALEGAISADPVAEELYRRLMRLQGQLGRPDAVRHAAHRGA